MVERVCSIRETPSVERRFFLASIGANAPRFAHAVRGHWGWRKRLHWRLDVIFCEDASRIRKGNACTGHHDLDPPTLREPLQARILASAPGAEAA